MGGWIILDANAYPTLPHREREQKGRENAEALSLYQSARACRAQHNEGRPLRRRGERAGRPEAADGLDGAPPAEVLRGLA